MLFIIHNHNAGYTYKRDVLILSSWLAPPIPPVFNFVIYFILSHPLTIYLSHHISCLIIPTYHSSYLTHFVSYKIHHLSFHLSGHLPYHILLYTSYNSSICFYIPHLIFNLCLIYHFSCLSYRPFHYMLIMLSCYCITC